MKIIAFKIKIFKLFHKITVYNVKLRNNFLKQQGNPKQRNKLKYQSIIYSIFHITEDTIVIYSGDIAHWVVAHV